MSDYANIITEHNERLDDASSNIANIMNMANNLPPAGGINTADATALNTDIAAGKTAYVNGEKITGTILDNRSNTMLTPVVVTNIFDQSPNDVMGVSMRGTSDAIISNASNIVAFPKYNDITNLYNITADKLVNGYNLFGINGTAEAGGINTADATATSIDIFYGKTAYANGEKLVGTMINGKNHPLAGMTNNIMYDNQQAMLGFTVSNATQGQTVAIDGTTTIGAAVAYSDMANTFNITPNVLANGYSLFGVNGNLDSGGGSIDTNVINIICNTINENPETVFIGFEAGTSGIPNVLNMTVLPYDGDSYPWEFFTSCVSNGVSPYQGATVTNVDATLMGEYSNLFTTKTLRYPDRVDLGIYASNTMSIGEEGEIKYFWLLAITNFEIMYPNSKVEIVSSAIPINVCYDASSCC